VNCHYILVIQNVFFFGWQMEISRYLRQHARTIAGKSQLFINSYAKALEVCLVGLTDFNLHEKNFG
jgi:chaperonin GroEL (HSP60 family)